MDRSGYNCADNPAANTLWAGLKEMLERWMEKLVESAASAYMPKVEEIAEVRRAELEEVRSKILSDPRQVELWFDKEIEKLGNISVDNILAKIKE